MRAMRPIFRPLLPLLVVPVLLAPAPASAKPVRHLWATVNRCDTPAAPNEIGVRASMPGTKSRQRLYMRFVVQFYSAIRQGFVDTDSSSRWLRVGDGRAAATQSGFNFRFDDPPEGQQFVLRGIVQFRYTAKRKRRGTRKRRWVVVKRYERLTRAGQRGVRAADPPGASYAMCIIRRGTGEGRS
jgi:hypothetical protein